MRTVSTYRKVNHMKNNIVCVCFLLTLIAAVFIIVFTAGNRIQAKEVTARKMYSSITINPGDSLWSIAVEHIDGHYSSIEEYIDELMSVNNLSSDRITAYEHLIVPYFVS